MSCKAGRGINGDSLLRLLLLLLASSYDIPQLESMFAHHNVFFLVTIIIFYSFPCIFFSMGGAIAVHVGVQGLLGPSLSGLAVIDVVEGKKKTLTL